MTSGSGPPTPVLSDYIELVYLSLLCLFGIPLNLLSLKRHSKRLSALKRRRRRKQPIHKSFTLLSLNLNLADLLIMLYTMGKIGWIWTYEWKGGLILCKLFKCFTSFCFYLNSNSILAIAFERVRAVVFPFSAHNGGTGFATGAIALSWVVAALGSLPQLWTWETLDAGSMFRPNLSWIQCTDIFTVKRHHSLNLTTAEARLEVGYTVAQLLFLFWVPLLLLIASYSAIAVRLAPCTSPPNLKRKSPTKNPLLKEHAVTHPTVESVEKVDKHRPDYQAVTEHESFSTGRTAGKTQFLNPQGAMKRNSSVLELSYETSARALNRSEGSQSEAKEDLKGGRGRRIFLRTALIVLAHVVLWGPSNAYSIIHLTDPALAERCSDSAHFLASLVVLNAVLNPFLHTRVHDTK